MNRLLILLAAGACLLAVQSPGQVSAGGATFVVDTTGNLSDSDTGDNVCMDSNGDCSLRAAIQQTNQLVGLDTINFNIPATEPGCIAVPGICTIQPDTPLPIVNSPVIIDGSTQPNFNPAYPRPVIQLNGDLLNGTVDGLRLHGGSSTVKGLVINEFGNVLGSDGIEIAVAGGNTIVGNCLGTEAKSINNPAESCVDTDRDIPGNGDSYGNVGNGVFINGTSNNTIGGTNPAEANVFGGNFDNGIRICSGSLNCAGTPATNNVVIGNFVGTDPTGTVLLQNANAGILIENAGNNIVGGTSAGHRNVISGNDSNGVEIRGSNASGNSVLGNYIGATTDGHDEQGNTGSGVHISGAPNNTVGGTAAGSRNLISGNLQGITIIGAASSGNSVLGNYIGTDAEGDGPLVADIDVGNLGDGIMISQGANNNTIGGTTAGARNIISGNGNDGIDISGSGSSENLIQGNYIGTDLNGANEVDNGMSGIRITNGASNVIGGTAAGARNLISGNLARGVQITGAGAIDTVIHGNLIGTDVTGTSAVGNGADGIFLNNSKDTVIGGTTVEARNIISGNGSIFFAAGVFIEGLDATGNTVMGNYIGTDITGTNAVGASADGIFINGSSSNTIGGTTLGARNVISGNGQVGILINGSTATGNAVQGNYVGLDASGTAAIPNLGDGIRVGEAPGNVIGGASSAARNVVSGNGAVGVDLFGSGAVGNIVKGNYIGTNAAGTTDVGNTLEGVYINGGINNTVGGAGIGDRNIISGNLHGVGVNDILAQNNDIIGNFIGTNAFGTGPIANTFDGVRVAGNASNNVVGGGGTSGNVIAYNGGDGVFLDQTAGTGNRIDLNQIFLNGQLAIDIYPDGVTPNDAGDGDTGPNNVQNFPVLTSANSTLAGTTIAGTLNSTPNTQFTIQIFSDSSCDPLGNGEGQLFVGSTVIGTDGTGNLNFNQLFPAVVANQHVVSGTATDPNGNTSEFSACEQVSGIAQPPLKQGDVNCDSSVNSVDALLVLRFAAGLSVQQNEPCPDVGTVISQVIGDVDCNGIVNSVDALKILRSAASLSVSQTEPCTDVGLVYP